MKNTLKGILHFIELVICGGLIVVSGSIPIALAAVVPAFISSAKLVNDLHGNKIEDSIFSVYRSGKIYQNTLAQPLRFLSIANDENKQERFVSEALSMFTQLEENNKKGKKKTYTTKSQSMTLMLLRTLEKNGYIENLEFEKAGKMHLYAEKIFMGNFEGFKKKYQMYQISFNLTDKERTEENLKELMKKKNTTEKKEPDEGKQVVQDTVQVQDKEKEEIIKPEVQEVTKEDLLKLREELISSKENSEKPKEEGKEL